MDTKAFLDDLLASARKITEQGRGMAEEKLGVPSDGSERDAMLSGMGKGALAAGALALLLGTGAGRRLTGTTLKLGGLAAVGGIAYKAYQNWQAAQDGALDVAATPVDRLAAAPAEDRSQLLLEAMIMAANADGHIDASERVKIERQMDQLGLDHDLNSFIHDRLSQAGGARSLAAKVDSAETAAEVYLVSRLIIDTADAAERRYLDGLVNELGLQPELVAELERQLAAG